MVVIRQFGLTTECLTMQAPCRCLCLTESISVFHYPCIHSHSDVTPISKLGFPDQISLSFMDNEVAKAPGCWSDVVYEMTQKTLVTSFRTATSNVASRL